MYCIEIHEGINNIMSLFYYLGLWHRGDKATVRESRIKLFYFIYYLLFPISTMVGAITSNSRDESILLGDLTIAATVLSMKLFYIIWRQDQIIEILSRIAIYSIGERQEFILANDKLKRFMKFVNVLLLMIVFASSYPVVVVPIFGKEKTLFFNIGFPLDVKNNEIGFWLASAFIFTEYTVSIITFLFSVMIWYLMINCALRYEILGCQIRNMGTRDETTKKRKLLLVEKQSLFLRDLKAAIDYHQFIRKLIYELESMLCNVFFIQIITSGIGISCAIYCLAFNAGEPLVEYCFHLVALFYNLSEIFMIMYFGNEIKFSSDRLCYCVFESNWINQHQETKQFVITFAELLKQPHELVIGKLYPLTLETFRRILNFAYNTFNILKNLK